MLAAGANLPLYNYDCFPESGDLLIRGMTKKSLIQKCWETSRTFFYMDGGYFGNNPSVKNPRGDKLFHRIVKNNLQHVNLMNFPSDRWESLDYEIKSRSTGKNVLIVAPSEKPCKFYGIDLQNWIDETIHVVKQQTDRPIIIRMKGTRKDRMAHSIFADFRDAHVTITYNSVAAVESVLEGVPAITLAPTAADPVAEKHIANIENPFYPDKDLIRAWAAGLAYGQYHIDELKDGSAYKLIYEHS
jgi:hypothetical protein